MDRPEIEYEDGTRVKLDDDDATELTDAEALWLVDTQDFGGNSLAADQFLMAREKILAAAEAEGIPRETFLPFEPNKPGFEERAKVLARLPKAMGWAAE